MDLKMVDQVREHSKVLVRELDLLQGPQRQFGASLSECHLIQLISASPFSSAGRLAEELNLDKSTTSRLVSSVLRKGWVQAKEDSEDKRRSLLWLTDEGQRMVAMINEAARSQVAEALKLLNPSERREVLRGLQLYAHSLQKLRKRSALELRALKSKDEASLVQLILTVLEEYECKRPGFASQDAELHNMAAVYQRKGHAYFVALLHGKLVGGAGIAPLEGGDGRTCELRKMYVDAEARGLGLGAKLLEACLGAAKEAKYERCYLETTKQMSTACRLYEAHGFVERSERLGETGHWGCDRYFERRL